MNSTTDNKQFVAQYLQALSGNAKTPSSSLDTSAITSSPSTSIRQKRDFRPTKSSSTR